MRESILRKIYLLALASVCLLSLGACGGDDEAQDNNGQGGNSTNVNANSTAVCKYAGRIEFPHLKNNGTSRVLVHTTNDAFDPEGVNFSTEWDTKLMSQRWSCYQLKTGYSTSGVSRYDTQANGGYPFDPQLKNGDTYLDGDYFYGSGFDHGHICPSASRLYSYTANYQTFYLTNMQPQYNAFNAGIWEVLEKQIRTWAVSKGTEVLYVCKGGTIDNEADIMQRVKGKLIVPKYYFVALMLKNTQGYKSIAFWFTHENVNRQNDKLSKYAESVDKLEERTGIDFFCNLPDDIENEREARCDLVAWGLN